MPASGARRLFSTLREKILPALLRASGEPKPSPVLIVLFGAAPGITVREVPTAAGARLNSDTVLNVLPVGVRRVVSGRTRPGTVRETGSTTATLCVTGSMILFVTMTGRCVTTTDPLTTTGLVTTTTVVKFRTMKKPGNQKPTHQLG